MNISLAYTERYGDNSTLSTSVPSTGEITFTVPTRRSASPRDGLITVTINTGSEYQIGTNNTASTAIERDPEPPRFTGEPQVQSLTETRITVSWPEPDSDHLQTTGYGCNTENRDRPIGGHGNTTIQAGKPP